MPTIQEAKSYRKKTRKPCYFPNGTGATKWLLYIDIQVNNERWWMYTILENELLSYS